MGFNFTEIKFLGFRGFQVKSRKSAKFNPREKLEVDQPRNQFPANFNPVGKNFQGQKKYQVKLTYTKDFYSGEWSET